MYFTEEMIEELPLDCLAIGRLMEISRRKVLESRKWNLLVKNDIYIYIYIFVGIYMYIYNIYIYIYIYTDKNLCTELMAFSFLKLSLRMDPLDALRPQIRFSPGSPTYS